VTFRKMLEGTGDGARLTIPAGTYARIAKCYHVRDIRPRHSLDDSWRDRVSWQHSQFVVVEMKPRIYPGRDHYYIAVRDYKSKRRSRILCSADYLERVK
jgi:hypothetical protein